MNDDDARAFEEAYMTAKKMIVTQILPPIPIRDFDWCAYWDGEEEGGHYGYGKTKEEAVEDLKQLDQEKWEADFEDGEMSD
jgi:hypothetical protein